MAVAALAGALLVLEAAVLFNSRVVQSVALWQLGESKRFPCTAGWQPPVALNCIVERVLPMTVVPETDWLGNEQRNPVDPLLTSCLCTGRMSARVHHVVLQVIRSGNLGAAHDWTCIHCWKDAQPFWLAAP